MSSLDILKQELVKQKQILEEKGFNVDTQYSNPSPSEITATINSIDSNMSKLSNLAISMITGIGGQEVYIPTDEKYTKIRDFAYYAEGSESYRHDNFVIPANISGVGNYAFAGCSQLYCNNFQIPLTLKNIDTYAFLNCSNLKGDVVFHELCTLLTHSFDGCTGLTSVEIFSDISSASYAFQNCTSLKKVTLHSPITSLPNYFLANCTSLEEVIIPSSVTKFGVYSLKGLSGIKYVLFENETPATIYSSTFNGFPTTGKMIVPYTNISTYSSASNYSAFANNMIGHGTFEQGEELPTTTTNYLLTWYATFEDAYNQVNPITICPASGRLYCTKN